MKYILTSLFILLFLFTACKSNQNIQNEEQIVKIGIIIPLTGDNSIFGQTMKEGVGFINDYSKNKNIKYQLYYEDDQFIPAKTVTAARKLINVDKVDFILTPGSQSAAVIAPIVAESNVKHFSNASDDTFTKYKNNYVFSTHNDDEVAALLSEIQKRRYKKIALISANETFSNVAQENIKKQSGNYGLDIIFDEKIMPTSRDFKMLFAKAETTNPDIYILQAWQPELDILMRQLKEANPNRPMANLGSMFMTENLDLYNGQFGMMVAQTTPDFTEKFNTKYNKMPEHLSSIGYAMMEFVLEIVALDPNFKSNEEFSNDIKTVVDRQDSIFGKLSLKGDNIVKIPVSVVNVKDGKYVYEGLQ